VSLSLGEPIDPRVRLAILLRFLAGGAVLDLMMIYCLSKSEIYKSIWRGVDAINKAIEVVFPLNDPEKLALLEREFRGRSPFPGWIGQVAAADGCHFRIRNPGKEVENGQQYHVDRKKCSALLVTALCDIHRCFLFWEFNVEPRTHDSQAWALSELGLAIEAGKLDSQYFINGDAAYVLGPQMIVPVGSAKEADFDYVQSANRVCIECAFGVSALSSLVTSSLSVSTLSFLFLM